MGVDEGNLQVKDVEDVILENCPIITKSETLRVRTCRCYAFGCKCEIATIRGGHRMARGWRYTKLSLSSALLLSFSGMCFVFKGAPHTWAEKYIFWAQKTDETVTRL